jgi:hypothetical protein
VNVHTIGSHRAPTHHFHLVARGRDRNPDVNARPSLHSDRANPTSTPHDNSTVDRADSAPGGTASVTDIQSPTAKLALRPASPVQPRRHRGSCNEHASSAGVAFLDILSRTRHHALPTSLGQNGSLRLAPSTRQVAYLRSVGDLAVPPSGYSQYLSQREEESHQSPS